MRRSIFALSLISLATATFAAQPVNLAKQSFTFLPSLTSSQTVTKELNRHVDFNHTAHIRVQQMYAGHQVWGADGIVHVPNGDKASLANLTPATTMNGIMYQGLAEDLNGTPAASLTPEQQKLALEKALDLHVSKGGLRKIDAKYTKNKLIVYVDKNKKAHWAYLIGFASGMTDGALAVPTVILDATTFVVYEQWNDLQTLSNTTGGGFGGNPKFGKISYDGLSGDYPALSISRKDGKGICLLENDDVIVKDDKNSGGIFSNSPIEKFQCSAKDADHNNEYWDADQDAVNEGYSPANDAMYIGVVVKKLYQEWYNLPVLTDWFGQPLQLTMHAHGKDFFGSPMDNAYFFPYTKEMYFGDGVKLFYPLTSLGVGAHELSHGFTSDHSNLTYEKQSGGMNEAYSDMAAQAAEFYSIGKNSWQIGPEIVKGNGALRYMDDPTKDGNSIDNVKDYTDDLNVHYTSGVFNKAFYTLGTTDGWDTRKAFNVMEKANVDYWTSGSTFFEAACGVMKAAADYKYNTADVAHAFSVVGINTNDC